MYVTSVSVYSESIKGEKDDGKGEATRRFGFIPALVAWGIRIRHTHVI